MDNFVLLDQINHITTHDTSCIHDGYLYLYFYGVLVVYDLRTNKKKYDHMYNDTFNISYTTICAFNDLIYIAIGTNNCTILIYNSDGFVKLYEQSSHYSVRCMVVHNNVLYLGTNQGTVIRMDKDYNQVIKCTTTNTIDKIIFYEEQLIAQAAWSVIVLKPPYTQEYESRVNLFRVHGYKNDLMIFGGLLYVFAIDAWYFNIIDIHKDINKQMHIDRYQSSFIRDDVLYIYTDHKLRGRIYCITKSEPYTLKRIKGNHTSNGRCTIMQWNDKIYSVYNNQVNIYGEYWPRHFNQLPDVQKSKIANWKRVSKNSNIQKDLSLLFTRELLKN